MRYNFNVGDHVRLVPEYAMVFDANEEDLHKIHVITRVRKDAENNTTEAIWIDDNPREQAPMYFEKVR